MKKPELSSIVIDKISLIAKFPSSWDKALVSYFQSFLGDHEKNGNPLASHPGKGKFGYKFAVNYNVSGLPLKHNKNGDAGNLLFQVGPVASWKDYSFRCEYNPNAIGPDGVQKISNLFEELYYFLNVHGELPDFWERFTVTRIDIAIDVDYVSIEDLVFFNARSQKWEIYFTEKLEGKTYIETQYLGGIKGLKRFCVYNKKEELRKNKKVHLSHERTRIECRLKPSKSFNKIIELKNPFLSMKIFDARELQEGNKKNWRWIQFLDSVRMRGPRGALNLIPKKTRAEYLKKLEKTAGTLWWRPEEAWESFPEEINKIGLGEGCLSKTIGT